PLPESNQISMLLQGRWEMVMISDSGGPSEPVPPGVFFTFQEGSTVALADCPGESGIPYTVINGGGALRVQVAPDSAVTWQLLTLNQDTLIFEEGSDVWTLTHRGDCAQPVQ
ncbi:MAG: hypothetical protein P8176_14390, partial [Gammaproteobacteria bacterium]